VCNLRAASNRFARNRQVLLQQQEGLGLCPGHSHALNLTAHCAKCRQMSRCTEIADWVGGRVAPAVLRVSSSETSPIRSNQDLGTGLVHVRRAAIHHGHAHWWLIATLAPCLRSAIASASTCVHASLSVPRGRDERCRLSRGTRQEESCPDSGEVIYHAPAGREGKSLPTD
jgi:hypothetical protein